MIKLNQDSLATLLLCSDLGLSSEMKKKYKPYTLPQWNKLAVIIINSSLQKPSALLSMDNTRLKDELFISDDEVDRIIFLLKRGGNLAIEIEKLESLGINITTRAEDNYPKRLKKVLKEYCPPIIYYSGDLDLVNRKSVAIIGSRDVDNNGILFTKKFASKCAKEGYVIISGGAKGVDSIAETTSIAENGCAISIVSNSLEKRIKERNNRNAIINGNLLVMSTVSPKANFTIYGAMNRNKYIYGLSNHAVVVSSSYGKGGTWSGATENLRKKWVPLYVRSDEEILLGNKKLIELGAKEIDLNQIKESNISIKEFFENNIEKKNIQTEIQQLNIYNLNKSIKEAEEIKMLIKEDAKESLDVYNIILPYIKKIIAEPKNENELSEILNVNKKQISTWVARAVEEEQIKKIKDSISYTLRDY